MQRYSAETDHPETNTIGHGAAVAIDASATRDADTPAAATVSTAIADVILARADHVFGLVGNANSHVVSHLTSRGFPYTSTRHEAGAVAAADAFFRAGGGIAVATTTCGAGFTNTITALAEAKAARVPMVYVTGSAPAAGARHFDLNQAGLLDALGIDHFTPTPETAAADAHAAFALAQTHQEPVVLLLPHDLQTAPLVDGGDVLSRPELLRPAHATPTRPMSNGLRAELAAVADALASARRPLILSGRGVVRAGVADDVAALGDRIGALHMHSAMARNVVGGQWCMGTAGGFTHRAHVPIARDADVVLVLGASFNAHQVRGGSLFSPDATVIHLTLEEHPSSREADVRVLCDLAPVMPVLDELVAERLAGTDVPDGTITADAAASPTASRRTWRDELGALPPAEDPVTQPELFHERGADGRLDPRAALRELDRILPKRRTVCTDGGHFLGWVPMYLDSPDPRAQVLVGTAIQTIGLGFPTAIGVAAARPDDYTVLVTGDGGGLMALSDAETVFRTVRRGAVVVMNDAAYGAELHQYRAEGLDTASMVIDDVDFAAVGRSFGARGVTVADMSDFARVSELLDDDPSGVIVIDVKISREVIADFISEVLKKQ
ncbi:thiamine pyrophosphate-binding protein [Corynebacterium freneyi]|uniref:thiamine pyrophosphate-binding protein n=1 Tax=Corynebacterium freneyi TaxID=134034 RepID=UPI001EF1D488|nr:thiamine pyrophosphate-dependent enzyme [Corynebacterium freneyi]